MKQEINGNTTAALAILGTRQFFVADLYTIRGGQMAANFGSTPLTYTSSDQNITFNGVVYSAGGQTGPYWDRKDNKAKLSQKVGTDVQTLVVDVLPASSTVFGVPFMQAIRNGIFDGAELQLDRAIMAVVAGVPVLPIYAFTMFVGRVAEIDAGRTFATFTVNTHLELFNLPIPRDLVSSGCINTLYDVNCTLLAANFQASGTVSDNNSTGSVIDTGLVTVLTLPLGKITFTSGANTGFSRTIRDYTSGSQIRVINPFPNAPVSGDTFTVNAGCDKQVSTCIAVFANEPNFRGFMYTPVPETGV